MNEMELARKIMHMTYFISPGKKCKDAAERSVYDVLLIIVSKCADAILKLHPKEGKLFV